MKYELFVYNKKQGVEEKVWTFFFTKHQLINYTTENGYTKDLVGNYVKRTEHSIMILSEK